MPNTLIKPTASDHFSEGYHQAGVQSVSRVPGIITFPGGLPIMTANKHRLGER